MIATPPALLGLLTPGDPVMKTVVFWDIYAILYLALTWLAFRRQPTDVVHQIVRRSRADRSAAARLLTSRREQLSQGAAMVALIAAAIALPRAGDSDLPTAVVIGQSGAAIVLAWLVLQVGFALLYLSLHTDHGGFEFPGTERPRPVDFAYLAVSVGTTFGTTDVTMTRGAVRRHVMAHSVLAFTFNCDPGRGRHGDHPARGGVTPLGRHGLYAQRRHTRQAYGG